MYRQPFLRLSAPIYDPRVAIPLCSARGSKTLIPAEGGSSWELGELQNSSEIQLMSPDHSLPNIYVAFRPQ